MADAYTERSWTSEDGLTLAFRDYAGPEGDDGVPVLCLHGLTRNARDFHDLALHLAEKRRVLIPEMRGRGNSAYASDTASYKPKQYVADVEHLLREEGIARFIAIGTSMGGLMTMMLAAADRTRIEAAVLNDIGPEIDPAGVARIGDYVGQARSYPTWVHAARSLADIHGAAFPRYDLDDWLKMAKRTMTLGQNGRISYDYDMAIAEPFRQGGESPEGNLWPLFDALHDVPTLLVRGALSDLLTPRTVEAMAARHSDLQTVTIPEVGHAPTLDEPEARAAIDALLARL
ncbi:alpha/beta fold hydrolase [Erythrobacter sp.]|jgi:pimeloyl-ACP methyl ester carboxylesterase|uniref:alpha/beta fold hydrolase n=1 Tax=Erythrobacter sp. TaxID=1042 RepID=UPI002EA21F21|nr:alpha/beta hydrolase [Erythrobacter sp.]